MGQVSHFSLPSLLLHASVLRNAALSQGAAWEKKKQKVR
jgi:hypothetical protein